MSVCSRLWSQTVGYAVTTNRIDSSGSNENAYIGPCFGRVLYFWEKGDFYVNEQTNDILYQAASVWKEMTEYCYILTYGYKNKLNTRLI